VTKKVTRPECVCVTPPPLRLLVYLRSRVTNRHICFRGEGGVGAGGVDAGGVGAGSAGAGGVGAGAVGAGGVGAYVTLLMRFF
jgi:hypothetical protein